MATRAYHYSDRRILAAIQFEDALGAAVRDPVAVSAPPGVRFFRKPTGAVILTSVPGLEAHETAFAAPPAAPAAGSIALPLDLRPAGRALAPRRAVVRLPRDADPDAEDSMLRPVVIRLLPGTGATVTGLAAAALIAVRRDGDGHVVEGALVQVRVPDRPVANAVTNAAGEALVLVPGIPLANPGPGATVVADLAAQADAVVPPDARVHDPDDAAAMEAARFAEAERRTGFADPDTLAGVATPAVTLRLARGRTVAATLTWSPP
jgi:hypothetical protein